MLAELRCMAGDWCRRPIYASVNKRNNFLFQIQKISLSVSYYKSPYNVTHVVTYLKRSPAMEAIQGTRMLMHQALKMKFNLGTSLLKIMVLETMLDFRTKSDIGSGIVFNIYSDIASDIFSKIVPCIFY